MRVSMGCARRGKVNHENITGFVRQAFKFSDFHKISPQKCQHILLKYNCVHTVYLSACHSNLGASVDVNSTVCLVADGTPHCVCDTNHQCSPGLAVPQCIQSVSCLPYREHHT